MQVPSRTSGCWAGMRRGSHSCVVLHAAPSTWAQGSASSAMPASTITPAMPCTLNVLLPVSGQPAVGVLLAHAQVQPAVAVVVNHCCSCAVFENYTSSPSLAAASTRQQPLWDETVPAQHPSLCTIEQALWWVTHNGSSGTSCWCCLPWLSAHGSSPYRSYWPRLCCPFAAVRSEPPALRRGHAQLCPACELH